MYVHAGKRTSFPAENYFNDNLSNLPTHPFRYLVTFAWPNFSDISQADFSLPLRCPFKCKSHLFANKSFIQDKSPFWAETVKGVYTMYRNKAHNHTCVIKDTDAWSHISH